MLWLRFFSLRVTRRRGLQGRCCLWMEVLPQGDRSELSRRRKRGPSHQSYKKGPTTTGMPRGNLGLLSLRKQNNGCQQPKPPAAANEYRAPIVVLFLIQENLARVGQTLVCQ